MREWKIFLLILGVFFALYFIPFSSETVSRAVLEAFYMAQEYAREHVLLCLIPAFFIAGAIMNFINKGAVMKYLGANANKILAYSVAAVSGSILAVCSCTVLPLFSGIYKKGAGLGPATAFLYSGPAINVLAIILTAKALGFELGIARAAGAILFSIVIGILMHFIFLREEKTRTDLIDFKGSVEDESPRNEFQNLLYFISMIGILVFINWGKGDTNTVWNLIFTYKYWITGIFTLILVFSLILWFSKHEIKSWIESTWDFAKQIMPLLLAGVFIAGFLLGRPGNEGLIPGEWVEGLVGGNSVKSNFLASIVGAFMYFATLTEVPILEVLLGSGMGKGPALALLLSGPALSLPNMLVIRSVLGTKKTLVYISLVVVMATISGIIFGYI
ncbi:MAG TPA: permease [Firmicutes bacterium]|nr:permease [Bacillota bacterium]